MIRWHVYDRVKDLEPQPDLKSLSSVFMLEDTMQKTCTNFGYTTKAFKSKKKLG